MLPTLIDGATGTELDRRGVDVTLPLWSARAITDAPEALLQVHCDYLNAGARAITTNTFRTHARSLERGGPQAGAAALTRQAVAIAQRARDQVSPDALVLGSVAPLEDCYSPDLAPDSATCMAEHAKHIDHLLNAGVDCILIETIGTAREAIAAADVAHERVPDGWGISFCLRHDGPPGVLLDGMPLHELMPFIEDACFIGVNCVSAGAMLDQVEFLASLQPKVPPIAVWANVGHPDPVRGWVNTDAVDPDTYAQLALSWLDAGAATVGGCCGTTPDTTRAIYSALQGRG
ncbi:MAG: homocysteine S-methyltransferase family protein [Phycisphaerales bacterium]|nr:homocysteine S-methyltransferase family protein [Phycisphaerales bacterium]